MALTNAADFTPGIAASLSRIAFCVRVTISGCVISVSGMLMRISCKCAASVKPGSTVRKAWNVRIIKPALTSSTSAIATCPTTNRLRARWRSLLTLALRPALRNSSDIFGPAYFSAGIRPNSKPEITERMSVNTSVRESSEISCNRGRFAGPIATRKRTPAHASTAPIAPPSNPSIVLSTSSPRTIRPHPAPSAARTASSCCRASTRTNSKFVTFAPAISSTRPSVPITTHSTSLTLPTTSCFNGRSSGVICQRSYQCGSLPGPFDQDSIQIGSMRVRSALACAIVTPGFSRAIPCNPKPARISFERSNASGAITSKSSFPTRNPGGITPTISRECASIIKFRPITERSAPKWRRQYPSLKITRSGPCGS